MRYLQDLCEMASVQAEHDWDQIKRVIEWCNDHYIGISVAAMGLPLLALMILEIICWLMLKEQNAALAELAQRLR